MVNIKNFTLNSKNLWGGALALPVPKHLPPMTSDRIILININP